MALVRFSSKAAGEIFMFEDNARTIFDIVGKAFAPKGIITADQVPAALSALRAAVDAEKRSASEAKDASDEEERGIEGARAVRLGQRAYPLIEMLERAAQRGDDVLWGV